MKEVDEKLLMQYRNNLEQVDASIEEFKRNVKGMHQVPRNTAVDNCKLLQTNELYLVYYYDDKKVTAKCVPYIFNKNLTKIKDLLTGETYPIDSLSKKIATKQKEFIDSYFDCYMRRTEILYPYGLTYAQIKERNYDRATFYGNIKLKKMLLSEYLRPELLKTQQDNITKPVFKNYFDLNTEEYKSYEERAEAKEVELSNKPVLNIGIDLGGHQPVRTCEIDYIEKMSYVTYGANYIAADNIAKIASTLSEYRTLQYRRQTLKDQIKEIQHSTVRMYAELQKNAENALEF